MARSRDAPMDFEFTDKDRASNVYAADSPFRAALAAPRKRQLDDVDVGGFASLGTPQRTFQPPSSANHAPFLFHSPAPSTPFHNAWSPAPAFPQPQPAQDLADVSMTDASPATKRVDPPPPQQEQQEHDESDDEEEDEQPRRRPVANGALRRVYNRRQREHNDAVTTRRTNRRRHQSDDDDDSEPDAPSLVKRLNVYFNPHAPIGSSGTPVVQDIPQLLVGYVQFFFNLSVVIVVLYLAVAFILTVQRDVEHRVHEHSLSIIAEISTCRQHWEANHCASPTHRAPILAGQCAEWAACMARDPTFVGRARVAAAMVGEVVDGFVEPISWKTLIFTLAAASVGIVLVNTLLSLYRARHAEALASTSVYHQPQYYQHQHQQHQHQQHQHQQHQQLGPPPGYRNGWTHANGAIEEPEPQRRRIE